MQVLGTGRHPLEFMWMAALTEEICTFEDWYFPKTPRYTDYYKGKTKDQISRKVKKKKKARRRAQCKSRKINR